MDHAEPSTSRPNRIGLIGPLPPPVGGMATQTIQLGELLSREQIETRIVQVNRPYRPAWISRIKGVRAAFRLALYIIELWRVAGRVDLFHVMANSGWSWYLYAAPAVWIARLRRKKVVINYRGGEAQEFFESSFKWIAPTLGRANLVVVPSKFLQQIFERWGVSTTIVPNIINLDRFFCAANGTRENNPHIIVTRNLESLYDVATAIRAFKLVAHDYPEAHLSIAGEGPEEPSLRRLVAELDLENVVTFIGRLTNDAIAELYRSADVMLNPSLADNMPNSVIEALASGVAVVSTNVGGVPYLVSHEETALLVEPGAVAAMGEATIRILVDSDLRNRLRVEGLNLVRGFTWGSVRNLWMEAYATTLSD